MWVISALRTVSLLYLESGGGHMKQIRSLSPRNLWYTCMEMENRTSRKWYSCQLVWWWKLERGLVFMWPEYYPICGCVFMKVARCVLSGMKWNDPKQMALSVDSVRPPCSRGPWTITHSSFCPQALFLSFSLKWLQRLLGLTRPLTALLKWPCESFCASD